MLKMNYCPASKNSSTLVYPVEIIQKIGLLDILHLFIKQVTSYRGISVTSALGKLFNSILDNRLDMFLEKHQIIDTCQVGFTRKARTTDHLFILKCIIDTYCNSKDDRVFACFVDFQKAFDTVIHIGIKIKLLHAGVGSLFYNIISRMYEISKSCVKVSNGITIYLRYL